jgi:hypothetical protein
MDVKGGFLAFKAVVTLMCSILHFLGDFVKHYEWIFCGGISLKRENLPVFGVTRRSQL